MSRCPCNSGKEFDECCNQYIRGAQSAETPEKLMRSRYSAYTKADIAYIKATMRGKASEDYDEISAAAWAKKVEWLGLSVLKSRMKTENKGFVEFIARFQYDGKNQKIHEKSEFHKIDGVWYYVAGEDRSSTHS